jgi:hypothetical protein
MQPVITQKEFNFHLRVGVMTAPEAQGAAEAAHRRLVNHQAAVSILLQNAALTAPVFRNHPGAEQPEKLPFSRRSPLT